MKTKKTQEILKYLNNKVHNIKKKILLNEGTHTGNESFDAYDVMVRIEEHAVGDLSVSASSSRFLVVALH